MYKANDFITIPLLPSILEILPSIPEKWGSSSKMVNFDAQKSEYEGQKKRLSPNPYWHGLFAKNGVQIGQFWAPRPPLYFTDAYRGSPPCTLSHHPDNRETGYSNVLVSSGTRYHQISDIFAHFQPSLQFELCTECHCQWNQFRRRRRRSGTSHQSAIWWSASWWSAQI